MMKNNKTKQYIFLGALLVVLLLIPQFVTDALPLQYMINILIFAYFTSMWNIVGGYAGQMALGNGVFIGIGAYVSAVLFHYEGISPWIGMFIGGAVCALFALIIGSVTFRLSGSYFALGTVAMLHIIRLLFTNNKVILGYKTKGSLSFAIKWRGGGLANMQFDSNVGYFYLLLGLLIVGILVSWYVKNSKMGYYLQAISTNPPAANSLGVNVMGMKLKANMISAFMMGLGGTFYAQFMNTLDPNRVLGYDMSVQILLFSIIGGAGTL
ncbi:MAG: branched-chain amino acid ABC transporter permease, partial [Clostridia bacterium]|nr:branched-chain amino acid ABC transporter permease [Clostridia bacterium]